MNFKWATAVVIVVGALVAWRIAGSKPQRAGPERTNIDASPPVDVRGAALAKEIDRLHDRAAAGVPPRLARNLFHFVTLPPRPAPVVPTVNRASDAAAALPQPALKLIGVAEDTAAGGLIRTAIISGPGQVFVVKEGERVTSRYQVARISADVVELQDLSVRRSAVDEARGDAGFRRLALK
jgi:hypothetical protein